MYCSHCGAQVTAYAKFCPSCGTLQPEVSREKRLERPLVGRRIGGVALGVARYMEVDPVIIRILFVLAALIPPSIGLLVYLVCWIVMPAELDHPAVSPSTAVSKPPEP